MRFAFGIVLAAGGVLLMPGVRAGERHSIDELRWLEGCWLAEQGSRTVEENWTVARGGTMIGVSRTVRDGKLAGYELVILKEQDGTLVYEAHPAAQATNEFRAVTVTDSRVVFEDLEHDFPQRVCYERVGTDSLRAWVEGRMNGKEKRIEFPYTRVACPGVR
jgi:hypothetical protein